MTACSWPIAWNSTVLKPQPGSGRGSSSSASTTIGSGEPSTNCRPAEPSVWHSLLAEHYSPSIIRRALLAEQFACVAGLLREAQLLVVVEPAHAPGGRVVVEVGELHTEGHRVAADARVVLVVCDTRRAREQLHELDDLGKHAGLEQLLGGDRRVFEHVVQPRHRGGHRLRQRIEALGDATRV